MPEFILNGKEKPEFAALPELVQGFIEAMFFTECSCESSEDWFSEENQEALSEGTIDGVLPNDVGFAELHISAIEKIVNYCSAFEEKAKVFLEPIVNDEIENYDMMRAGHDLWYTSNGHGVGFWDRKELDENGLGDKLSNICRYNEMYASYGEDGFVYLD